MPSANKKGQRLNTEAYTYLRHRREKSEFNNEFSLIFVGDSHLGQECSVGSKPENNYKRLLDRIIANNNRHNIMAVIHGGDGTHGGPKYLERFVELTRTKLGYGQEGKEPIPLFVNVGNHEYIHDSKLTAYNSLVGDGNNVGEIWLRPQNICMLLLNTGGPNSNGHFLDEHHFLDQISAMQAIIKAHPHYRFIIDMHIPPAVGPHKGQSHALKPVYTSQFENFLDRNLHQIKAVVSHHRHCVRQKAQPYYYKGRIPLYITAFGGHCDCMQLGALKLSFTRSTHGEWKGKHSLI